MTRYSVRVGGPYLSSQTGRRLPRLRLLLLERDLDLDRDRDLLLLDRDLDLDLDPRLEG